MPRFVLEIGTEEMPPRFFPHALPQLREQGEKMLQRARLTYREVKVYGTPRRLALIAEDLADRQAPAAREERGPPARAAYDERGRPTKAALGFARRHGVAVEQLQRRQTDQGDYVFALIQEPELPAKQALAPLLPALITGLTFPKMMRWGAGELRFGRPIRWLLALLDDQVVEFQLAGLKSGRLTRGHPTLADGLFPVADARDYEEALRELSVLVNDNERRRRIESQIEQIQAAQNARALGRGMSAYIQLEVLKGMPEEFAREIETNLELRTTFLVEWPTAALGHFTEAGVGLPAEVLESELTYVQGYFPLVARRTHGFLPGFIAVRDGGDQEITQVVRGWESVLHAKLTDARYFYEQDLRTPLEQRVEALRGVVFQESLGTMYDKMERLRLIVAEAARQPLPGESVDAQALDRAAFLCKADLTTAVVAELPELEGVIGGIYAKHSGEPREAYTAIADHYRPRGATDQTPETTSACILALSDKLDTIAACLAAGLRPTGSADPYGLRQAATGVIRILGENGPRLSIATLVRAALDALYRQVQPARPKEEVFPEVMAFLRQRLDNYLQARRIERGGPLYAVRHDLVDAALAVGFDDVSDATARARALQHLADSERDFLPTVIAATRPSNILGDFSGGEVNPDLFEHDTERALWEAYLEVKPQAERQADEGRYEDFFRTLGSLRELIDTFFTDVLVMHEDPALRRNRLALCWQISQLFRRLADFSLIVQM